MLLVMPPVVAQVPAPQELQMLVLPAGRMRESRLPVLLLPARLVYSALQQVESLSASPPRLLVACCRENL